MRVPSAWVVNQAATAVMATMAKKMGLGRTPGSARCCDSTDPAYPCRTGWPGAGDRRPAAPVPDGGPPSVSLTAMATLVCFHAHPDDEALSTGGLIAKASAAGHRVIVVTATNGEQGEPVPGVLAPGEELWERRIGEVAEACAILGAESRLLGYRDSGMMDDEANDDPRCFWQADVEEAAERPQHHPRRGVGRCVDDLRRPRALRPSRPTSRSTGWDWRRPSGPGSTTSTRPRSTGIAPSSRSPRWRPRCRTRYPRTSDPTSRSSTSSGWPRRTWPSVSTSPSTLWPSARPWPCTAARSTSRASSSSCPRTGSPPCSPPSGTPCPVAPAPGGPELVGLLPGLE